MADTLHDPLPELVIPDASDCPAGREAPMIEAPAAVCVTTYGRQMRPGRALAEEYVVLFDVPARFEVEDEAWRALLERYRMGRQCRSSKKAFERRQTVCDRLGAPLVDPRPALGPADLSGRPPYSRGAGCGRRQAMRWPPRRWRAS
jgi:hypothetical protein